MKLFKFFITEFSFFILWDCANCINTNDLVSMAIEQVQPHHCVFWKKIDPVTDNKTNHFINNQLKSTLIHLLKKIPTTQVDLNNLRSFSSYN